MSGPHGVERHGRVDQRFAFRDRRGRDVHVHDVGAETLAREFERTLRSGRGFEKQVDQSAPSKNIPLFVHLTVGVGGFVGDIEKSGDFAGVSPSQVSRCRRANIAFGVTMVIKSRLVSLFRCGGKRTDDQIVQ